MTNDTNDEALSAWTAIVPVQSGASVATLAVHGYGVLAFDASAYPSARQIDVAFRLFGHVANTCAAIARGQRR